MILFHNRILKACPLVAASLILPALAYADRDHDRDSNRDNHQQRAGGRDRQDSIPVYLRQMQGGC